MNTLSGILLCHSTFWNTTTETKKKKKFKVFSNTTKWQPKTVKIPENRSTTEGGVMSSAESLSGAHGRKNLPPSSC